MVVTIVNQKAWIAINIIHAINDPGWANIPVGITCQRQNYSNGNKIVTIRHLLERIRCAGSV